MGMMFKRMGRGATGVVRKTPAIRHKASCWMTANFAIIALEKWSFIQTEDL
jgi:hypothetical protein